VCRKRTEKMAKNSQGNRARILLGKR